MVMKKNAWLLALLICIGICTSIVFYCYQDAADFMLQTPIGVRDQNISSNTAKLNFSLFILQLACIFLVAKTCGFISTRLGQPAVIGEMIAGILLGPSLLGWLMPTVSKQLFPSESLVLLKVVSQLGMVLYLFSMGLEFNLGLLKSKIKSAVFISHASIVIPFLGGLLLAPFLYHHYSFPGVPFHAFAIFMGLAISVTAFPVLARIIEEKGLSHTRLGTLAMTVAAVDDVSAWLLLSFVLFLIGNSEGLGFGWSLGLVLLYLAAVYVVVKGFSFLLKYFGRVRLVRSQTRFALALLFLLMLVYGSEKTGLHALFGAFLAGVVLPFSRSHKQRLGQSLQTVFILLLPLFFVFTGLNTKLSFLGNSNLWPICIIIIFVATASKFLGAAWAARLCGEPRYESLAIGALVNTRGLMELVILGIGYEAGILDGKLFTMMVVMTIVTTVMTGPALTWIGRHTNEQVEKKKINPLTVVP